MNSILKLDTQKIFVSAGLFGDNLLFKKDVTITVSDGLISSIESNTNPKKIEEKYNFSNKILIPGFINSHTHIGDFAGLDKAWKKPLEETVGKNGIKYTYLSKSNLEEIISDGLTLLKSLGVFGFVDFREQGKFGVDVLKKAQNHHPELESRILGRPLTLKEPNINDEISTLMQQRVGIGLNRTFDFDNETLKQIHSNVKTANQLIGVHLGEDVTLDSQSINQWNESDFFRTLNYLRPDFVVHLTNLTLKQLHSLPKTIFPVLCPRSNHYFNTGLSPVKYFVNKRLPFALGTDNFMAINPSPIEELQFSFFNNYLNNTFEDFIHLLKSITTIPSNFFNFSVGNLKIGKKLNANLLEIPLFDRKYSNWWNFLLFRATKNYFRPIVIK